MRSPCVATPRRIGSARQASSGASAAPIVGRVVQGGAAEAIDLLEDAQAALDDEAQLPAGAAADRVHERRAASISSRAQATSSAIEGADAVAVAPREQLLELDAVRERASARGT